MSPILFVFLQWWHLCLCLVVHHLTPAPFTNTATYFGQQWETDMQVRISPRSPAAPFHLSPPCLSPCLSSPPPSVFAPLLLLPSAAFGLLEETSQPGWIHSGSHGANLDSRPRNVKWDCTFPCLDLSFFTDQSQTGSEFVRGWYEYMLLNQSC